MQQQVETILHNIERVMIGKREVAELSLVALLSKGHVLLEDVPGVGKTMMVKSLATSLGLDFKRIQFTPDLLPSDVVGVSIYNPNTMQFEFRPGPLLGNIILADEINRTSPKTQSALLEGMEEASVTIDGNTIKIPQPFFVMATQNPIEYEGTYPLPEAQLDRFLLKIKMGYPTQQQEMEILRTQEHGRPIENLSSVVSIDDILTMQKDVQAIHIEDNVKHYIVQLATATRNDSRIYLGASPRASVSLMRAAQAYAFIQGRDYVKPDDVQYLAKHVFSHRIILKPEARYEGFTEERVVENIVDQIPVPVKRYSE